MWRSFFWDLYLFAPAFVGNSFPILAKLLPGISRWRDPVDEVTFGRNKTWRGLAAGVVGGLLTAVLQQFLLLTAGVGAHIPLLWSLRSSLLVGALLGFGAITGDMVESAIKRRIGIPPGGALPFWDGADHIIGALVVLSPVYLPSVSSTCLLLAVAPILSLMANTFSFVVGWKDRWY